MFDIKRYDGETEEQLLYRVGKQKEEIGTWEDVADVMNGLLGQNYGEAKYRKQFAMLKKFMKSSNIDEDCLLNNIDTNDIEKLQELKDDIYKERCRLQDANRERRNILREEARFENLKEVLKENLDKITYEIKNYKPIDKKQKTKVAILQLSDWHCGALVNNRFNTYNIKTMVERATIIRDKAIQTCKNHNVTDLIIEINGDMVSGLIHVSSRVQAEESVVQQIITVTDVLAKIINSMKPYFNSIRVVTTLGNHGRLLPNKSDTVTNENFEMLIPIMLRDKLKDVDIIDSKGLDFVPYQLFDKIILLAHGQNDNLNRVISDFSKMFKIVPSEIHLGHTHSYKDINDCNIQVTVNGSLIGSDDYAISVRKVTVPSQNLIIYENDRCIYELKAKQT